MTRTNDKFPVPGVSALLIIMLTLSGCMVLQESFRLRPDANKYCNRIQKFIPSIGVITNVASIQRGVAGVYNQDGPESQKHEIGRLVIDKIHIFPNQEYYYSRQSDLRSENVYDKGFWTFDAGLLNLHTDGSLSKKEPLVKKFLVLGCKFDERSTILLMRIDSDYDFFVKFSEEGEDENFNIKQYESILLICSYERTEDITSENLYQIKDRLQKRYDESE